MEQIVHIGLVHRVDRRQFLQKEPVEHEDLGVMAPDNSFNPCFSGDLVFVSYEIFSKQIGLDFVDFEGELCEEVFEVIFDVDQVAGVVGVDYFGGSREVGEALVLKDADQRV